MGNSNDHDKKDEKDLKEANDTSDDQTEKTVEVDRANVNTVVLDKETEVKTADIESLPFGKFCTNVFFFFYMFLKKLLKTLDHYILLKM